jgi:hypothetical protein
MSARIETAKKPNHLRMTRQAFTQLAADLEGRGFSPVDGAQRIAGAAMMMRVGSVSFARNIEEFNLCIDGAPDIKRGGETELLDVIEVYAKFRMAYAKSLDMLIAAFPGKLHYMEYSKASQENVYAAELSSIPDIGLMIDYCLALADAVRLVRADRELGNGIFAKEAADELVRCRGAMNMNNPYAGYVRDNIDTMISHLRQKFGYEINRLMANARIIGPMANIADK